MVRNNLAVDMVMERSHRAGVVQSLAGTSSVRKMAPVKREKGVTGKPTVTPSPSLRLAWGGAKRGGGGDGLFNRFQSSLSRSQRDRRQPHPLPSIIVSSLYPSSTLFFRNFFTLSEIFGPTSCSFYQTIHHAQGFPLGIQHPFTKPIRPVKGRCCMALRRAPRLLYSAGRIGSCQAPFRCKAHFRVSHGSGFGE